VPPHRVRGIRQPAMGKRVTGQQVAELVVHVRRREAGDDRHQGRQAKSGDAADPDGARSPVENPLHQLFCAKPNRFDGSTDRLVQWRDP
jgi:hypothetical protein